MWKLMKIEASRSAVVGPNPACVWCPHLLFFSGASTIYLYSSYYWIYPAVCFACILRLAVDRHALNMCPVWNTALPPFSFLWSNIQGFGDCLPRAVIKQIWACRPEQNWVRRATFIESICWETTQFWFLLFDWLFSSIRRFFPETRLAGCKTLFVL